MATTITSTIEASGGDYTSVNAWIADEMGNTGDFDLVAADELREAICGDLEDTTKATVTGFTTDATRFWRIQADDDHGGVFSTSVYRLKAAGKDGFKASDAATFAEIIGIQLQVTGTVAGEYAKLEPTSGTMLLEKIVIYGAGADDDAAKKTTGLLAGKNNGPTYNIFNCVVSNFNNTNFAAVGLASKSAGANIFNCVAENCEEAFAATGNSPLIKNCITKNCADGFNGTFSASSTNNTSDVTADPPGSNPEVGSITFVDDVSDPPDLHLASSMDGNALIDGVDLSGSFTDDIDGETRVDWDRGFDEIIASGPSEDQKLVDEQIMIM